MFKRIVTTILAVLMLCTTASAASVEFTVGSENFWVKQGENCSLKAVEAAPFINEQSRTMVPVRAIADAFGAAVDWNGETRTVTIKKDDKEISLVIDKNEAMVNGEVKVLDTCPVIVANRTFVPLRFVGEALSCNVQYVNATKQILIDDSVPVVSCGDVVLNFRMFEEMYNILYEGNYDQAREYGLDDITYGQIVAQLALESASAVVLRKAAFPSVSISSEEKDTLLSMVEILAVGGMSMDSMTGYMALVLEWDQIASGDAIYNYVEETEDIKAFYENNFVLAKHVLVSDEALANDVYKKAVDGADFDALVAEYGQDPGMEQNPNGYVFTKGEMVIEFEEASFGAKIGEITKPVKTDFGYHIIYRLPLPELTDADVHAYAEYIIEDRIRTLGEAKVHLTHEEICEKLGIGLAK